MIIIANKGSSLVRPPTQSRHSVYKKKHLVCSLERARRAYTSALAERPLFRLRCHRQHPDHRQRSAGGC